MSLKILAIFLSIVSLNFAVPTEGYNPVGTGEAGLISLKMPEKINYLHTGGGNVDPPPNVDRLDPRFFTLNGALTDSELEAEINEFIMDSVENFDTTYTTYSLATNITALNGYIEVNVDYGHMDGSDYTPDGVIAIWNMKTGERLTRFSDMFYKDSHFLPAVISAERNYQKDDSFTIEKEPEKFSMIALLTGSSNIYENLYDGIPTRDCPLYAMSDAWGFMPMWQYYDMSEMFTGKPQNNLRNLVPRDFYPEEFTERYESTGKINATYIASSLYLSNKEISRRNAQLKTIYETIKTTEIYKNQVFFDDDPMYTTIDFDGDIVSVSTDYGTFARNRKTGEIFTPENCKLLSADENFCGFVDIDIDGNPEIISVYDEKEIRIYNKDLSLKNTVPFPNQNGRNLPLMINIKKDKKTVSGEIFITDYKGEILSAKFEDGEFGEFVMPTISVDFGWKEAEASIAKAAYFIENDFTNGVIYAGNALNYSDTEYLSGTALAHFEKIKKAAYTDRKNVTTADRNKNGIEIAVWEENELFINGVSTDNPELNELPSYYMSVQAAGKIETSFSAYSPIKRHLQQAFTVLEYSNVANASLPEYYIMQENGFAEIEPLSHRSYAFTTEDGEITVDFKDHSYEDFSDSAPMGLALALPYWFRASTESYYGFNIPFAEYGGVDFPIEDFREMTGGAGILDEIEENGGTVLNILYRDNGIININYKEPHPGSEAYGWYYYKYKTYRDRDEYNTPPKFVGEGSGYYSASVTAEWGTDLAKFTYPDELPYIGSAWWLEDNE
jgi:hypothetical protein